MGSSDSKRRLTELSVSWRSVKKRGSRTKKSHSEYSSAAGSNEVPFELTSQTLLLCAWTDNTKESKRDRSIGLVMIMMNVLLVCRACSLAGCLFYFLFFLRR
jgi:hypothetical protein